MIRFNGKIITPAPLIEYSRQYQTTPDGEIIGSVYSFTIAGTLVAFAGSPNSSGVFATSGELPNESIGHDFRLGSLLNKQAALLDLFGADNDGKLFEVVPIDESTPYTFNPRILGPIQFPQGVWYDTVPYTISLEADSIDFGGQPIDGNSFGYHINSATEDWAFETQESPEDANSPRTYRLSHNISAVGKRFYNSSGVLEMPAWQQARNFVLPRLGLDNAILLSSGVKNLPSYMQGLNHVRDERIDELGGTYSITESWVIASGTAIEDFTVTTTAGTSQGTTNVKIDGSVVGLEVRNSGTLELTSSKYTNAATKYSTVSSLAFSRAQLYSGVTLNSTPLNNTVGKNPVTGTINYSLEYDDRPSNCITGSKSESVVVTDNLPGDVFAAITVLGRNGGPVLQGINTYTARSRGLDIELVMSPATFSGCTSGALQSPFLTQNPINNGTTGPQIQAIIDAVNPSNGGFGTVFKSPERILWDARSGRFSYSVEWVFE